MQARTRAAWPLLLLCTACTHGLFSGANPPPDRSHPVARIETRGGVEYGATTREGILFLGRTAKKGPCRVHYFLGPTPVVEDGTIRHLGGIYYLADIDLKTQAVDILSRDPTPQDDLIAMVHAGLGVGSLPVHLAAGPGLQGDLLAWPGTTLPAGAAIFARKAGGLRFVGLVAGRAEFESEQGRQRYLVFAGTDRLREALAQPHPHPVRGKVKFRPDDITVIK